jgi:hypothetical protein
MGWDANVLGERGGFGHKRVTDQDFILPGIVLHFNGDNLCISFYLDRIVDMYYDFITL